MTKFPCVESTIDVPIGDFWVRLWINKKAIPENLMREQEILNRIRRYPAYGMPHLLRKIIREVPDLNAVQVRNGAVGTVVYCVDFQDKDLHG